ncbi:MAG: ADP-forming succinate--CoA ligase subunit beta [Planctomycetota bacterium]|nr:ADP-forming succinate--CoA ligase subunit beta [Planctomycetota bacterium]
MKLHEYQAKEQFRAVGLATPTGVVVTEAADAAKAYIQLEGDLAVVKAQIHAGGRGKAGGVKLVRSADEAQQVAESLLGKPLVTIQNAPDGTIVNQLLVEEGLPIEKEYYAAVVLDRQVETPVLMASAEGGMDIEEVAATNPDAILREPIDPTRGLSAFRARRLAFGLGVPKQLVRPFASTLMQLARVFLNTDASLVEVNPLVTTTDGRVVCLDGKLSLDDNALYRHKDLVALRDESEEDPTELRARKNGLSYVKLDGNIGCLVNGAGLAMATMDIIKHHGGEPANFLDVGGSASTEQVTTAFSIILEDPNVKGILVNIFGGIMRCDVVAQGVVDATKALGLEDPLVVRLHGTNMKEGKAILEQSGLKIVPADNMTDAAQKIVELTS